MKEFILDKNVDLKPSQSEYPEYFFNDLRKASKVRLVIGGSGYRKEVREKPSLLELFGELITSGKVRTVANADVDIAQKTIEDSISRHFTKCPNECDDPHIFALAQVSGCRNVITKETRMATCKNIIRNRIGHNICPDLRIVRTKSAYDDTRQE